MWPDSLAVVGLDALGGSLAWQARVAGDSRLIGFSASPADAIRALETGALTDRGGSPAEIIPRIPTLVPCLAPDSILSDLVVAR